ncbi:MAG: polysaccharide biosynthesis tyrosine autokinase [bacterium]
MHQEESVELRQYWQVLWRHKWIVLQAVVVVLVGTMIFTYRQPTFYRASSKVLVNPPPSLYPYTVAAQILTSKGLPFTSQGLPYYINYLENYRIWMTSGTIRDKIEERVKSLYPQSEEISFSMSTSVIEKTSIFHIGIEAGDPELCKVAANAAAQVMVEENQKMFATGLETASKMMERQIQTPLEELDKIQPRSESKGIGATKDREPESQLWQAGQLNNVRIMDYAKRGYPIKPPKKRNALLGLLVGFMLGGGLAFLLAYLDTSVRTIQDVEKYFSWPVLGIIPRFDDTLPVKTSRSEIEPVVSEHPKSVLAEAYRTLRTNIQLANLDRPPRSLVVTSAGPLEGKSTTALNLAVALAHKESKVLLVDADLRKSVIHKALKLDNSTGLADLVHNHDSLEAPVKPSDSDLTLNLGGLEAAVKRLDTVDNLWVLTSGSKPSNPSELLGSSQMSSLIEQAKKEYDYLVFDTPPLMSVSDGAVLSSQTDAILVVIRPGKLKKEVALRTKELVERIQTPVLGAVLNNVEPNHSDYYYYYRYYHYYDSSERKERVRRRRKRKKKSLVEVLPKQTQIKKYTSLLKARLWIRKKNL